MSARELVRIPTADLQTAREKSTSWFKGQSAPDLELSAPDLNKSESVVSEATTASDTASVQNAET